MTDAELIQRVRALFLQKLTAKNPDHPWLKLEQGATTMNRAEQAETLVPQLIEVAAMAWAKDDPNILYAAVYPLQQQGWTLDQIIALLVTALCRAAGKEQQP
jgi:hypothetical protein